MLSTIAALSLLAVVPFSRAVPMPLFGINFGGGQTADGAPTAFAQSDIDANLLRPAQFARLAYCSPGAVTALNCGAQCDAVSTIQVLQAGGDGGATPRCE